MSSGFTRITAATIWSRKSFFFRSLCLGVICLLLFTVANAQKSTVDKEKETRLARRARAIDLIVETAETALVIKDLFYRARIQALAADALWPHDEARARVILRRAWEAATASDKSEEEALGCKAGLPCTISITEARDEVLAKAAARDSTLTDAFLQDLLAEESKQEDLERSQTQTQRRTPWREVSPSGQQRLALAYGLLSQNNPARAADVASPVIAEGESGELMAFILRLREADNARGEAFYLRLIERTRLSRDADSNTVLLLSSQITSPWLLVVVDDRGSLQFRRLDRTVPDATVLPGFSQSVESTFYNVSASILLRPLIPHTGQGMTGETIALYIAIGRLLPYFERGAPQYVAELRLRNNTLANAIDADRRETLDSVLERNSLTPTRPGDLLRPQIDQLGRARDARDRDRIAIGIVKKAAQNRLWDRARRAAMEIEDVDSRRSALSFIAVTQVADLLRTFTDDKEENFDGLAKFVRNADVPRLVTAWGLAQIAIMAKRKGDIESATTLLDEAVMFAARTPAGTWQRVAAYIAVTHMAARIDVNRAWEIMPEVVRAANAYNNLTGDEDSIDIETHESNSEEVFEPLSVESEVFRVDSLFVTMAQLDYEKALTSARSIGRESPRAFASLAVARVMLK